MKLIVRFLPLVVFTALSTLVSWQIGVFAALLAIVGQVALVRPHRLGVLGVGMATFFAGASLVALVAPSDGVEVALHPVAAAWMALVAVVSVAIDRPFTAEVAAQTLPPEVVASPQFLPANKAITIRWAWTFLAIAAVSTFAAVTGAPLLAPVFTVAALVFVARSSLAYGERVAAAPSAV